MPCNTQRLLIEAAVCSLIKEIIATFESRRRARRDRVCAACRTRLTKVAP
jgi:hypothetical protein